MVSQILQLASHEAENQTDLSLRRAFQSLEPELRPPFSIRIFSHQEYEHCSQAIIYGILCEPQFARTHVTHLYAIVTDGFAIFTNLLIRIVNELYPKLVASARQQVIWITEEMVKVSAVGFDDLLVCLMRQMVGGDYNDANLWLCFKLANLLLAKWDCIVEEQPLVLSSVLYTYLRLLADHCRLSSTGALEELKRFEIGLCVKIVREQFHCCLRIGQDLIRLLQDLICVPEIRSIWKDLVINPSHFKSPGFSDISDLYCIRTSSRFFLLRITPEMETQVRFLLEHVKLGDEKQHMMWFKKKFLDGSDREIVLVDLVRFICCAHHPSNEVIQSDIIPRWAVIGWLLKYCRKNYVEANMKLALFYDWLFFREGIDRIMNLEPAMLLMVYSIPKYMDITHTLLDYLLLLVENYDLEHKDIIVEGVLSAFGILVRKGVIRSLDVLTSELHPALKERLGMLLSGAKVGASETHFSSQPFKYIGYGDSKTISKCTINVHQGCSDICS